MRVVTSWAGIVLLAACAHGSSSQPPPSPQATQTTAPAAESSASLGTLQPSSTAAEARHEPVAPDAPVTGGSDPGAARAEPSSSDQSAAPNPAMAPTADATQLSREESALRERIQRRLRQDKSLSFTAQRVRLDVKRQDVTVQGEVRTAREKQDVERLIESIEGVRRVHNQLAVIDQTNPDAPSGLHTR